MALLLQVKAQINSCDEASLCSPAHTKNATGEPRKFEAPWSSGSGPNGPVGHLHRSCLYHIIETKSNQQCLSNSMSSNNKITLCSAHRTTHLQIAPYRTMQLEACLNIFIPISQRQQNLKKTYTGVLSCGVHFLSRRGILLFPQKNSSMFCTPWNLCL